ncbi:MAG: hypothetical protein Q9174_003115 [Haloplaca sp. 1 TL-2023]
MRNVPDNDIWQATSTIHSSKELIMLVINPVLRLLLYTFFISSTSCIPIQIPSVPSPFSLTSNLLVKSTSDPSPLQITVYHLPAAYPLNVPSARAAISAVYAIIRTHDRDATIPHEGIDILRNGVGFRTGPLSKDFTWDLLYATVQHLEAMMRDGSSVTYAWHVSKQTFGNSIGQGFLYVDAAAGASKDGNRSSPSFLSLPTQANGSDSNVGLPDFRVSIFYGNETHYPFDRHDVEQAFGIAFFRIDERDLEESMPQTSIGAGTVVLSTVPFTPGYTWGFFAETLRQVHASESARPAWWHCGWSVVGVDADQRPTTLYAVGQLHPAHWDEEWVTGDVEAAYDNVRVTVRYEEPPHPLNRQDAEGVFDLAFLRISQHDPDDPMPRRGAEIRAGNVILDTSQYGEEYTWGLWDYTLRQVRAAQSSQPPGWWSCGFDVVNGGSWRHFYATGRLYSAVGEERKGTGELEVT